MRLNIGLYHGSRKQGSKNAPKHNTLENGKRNFDVMPNRENTLRIKLFLDIKNVRPKPRGKINYACLFNWTIAIKYKMPFLLIKNLLT